jgi:hypothetical protein
MSILEAIDQDYDNFLSALQTSIYTRIDQTIDKFQSQLSSQGLIKSRSQFDEQGFRLIIVRLARSNLGKVNECFAKAN